ncbi:TlpA disulfide reductase family protein [Dehalococcoides sp. THU3]|uniref:peroxiredoxin family protein n=1 Tax=Dehalococcoides TaxID=61434 RepID=UPI0005B575DA|nr:MULTISPECIES: TlpA disulfide reductase family protein [Dehalococcoides]QYY58172.1 TlpA family protein disulfide reductase [Dehalococcoides mccartyi]BAQ34498.1 thiol-disulfide oxidoreductase [Dehalococcoides sp. UCH007]
MKSKLLALCFLLLGSLCLSACSQSTPSPSDNANQPVTGIKINNFAPDFSLKNLAGQEINLSDFRGSGVIINFWKISCSYCKQEMPFFEAAYLKNKTLPDSIKILMINITESQSLIEQFMEDNHYTFPVLLDTTGAIGQIYNANYIPITYFINTEGIIKAIKFGAFSSQTDFDNQLDKIY